MTTTSMNIFVKLLIDSTVMRCILSSNDKAGGSVLCKNIEGSATIQKSQRCGNAEDNVPSNGLSRLMLGRS